jgi:hypothetical protein
VADHPELDKDLFLYAGDSFWTIESLQNADVQAQAVAMLDAYLEVWPQPGADVVKLLIAQGRIDRAKPMLHELISSGDDVLLGVMLLRDFGEDVDVTTLKTLDAWSDGKYARVNAWLQAIDALAWHGATASFRLCPTPKRRAFAIQRPACRQSRSLDAVILRQSSIWWRTGTSSNAAIAFRAHIAVQPHSLMRHSSSKYGSNGDTP